MNLKEYLKEMVTKIDGNEEKEILRICMNDDIFFNYHNNCFADFHDDFCILYDKNTEVSMVIPYGKIMMMQHINREIFRKQMEEFSIGELFKKLMED